MFLQEEIANHNTQFEENELELEKDVKEYNDKKPINSLYIHF